MLIFTICNFSITPPIRVGGYKWYRIEIPMLQGDAKTQIAFFQLCDRGPTPLLKDEATKTQVFFENDPTLRTDISTLI